MSILGPTAVSRINERFGPEVGDRVARYAGDAFVLMIDDIPSREVAAQVRQHLEKVLLQPLKSVAMGQLPGAVILGGAVGMADYPGDAENADELVKLADHDIYERKRVLR